MTGRNYPSALTLPATAGNPGHVSPIGIVNVVGARSHGGEVIPHLSWQNSIGHLTVSLPRETRTYLVGPPPGKVLPTVSLNRARGFQITPRRLI